ncbi:ParB/RepB/Spo0J family partition protein [Streptomyces sp. AD681]|uniref:ParB/RepB/Spo0J family partition protein n=1 Tax=Streptomyces sp. AD681 TaxID=3019069 RepID=UPI0022F1ADE5|nr:ParB/RepB/Spo0J family partition protein [Streptomyces sp. AD681]MDA5145918.1 ParB/RepB/Spo0J family partition protein [Streptomyces sp. AD681]
MKSTEGTLESLTDLTDWVKVDTLLPADSPRLNGLDEQHVKQLADVYPTLPPILVHSRTMRVIDGMHRLAAARRNRLDVVEVRYFTGTEEESFLRSVSANVAHGLPLSPDERKTAAHRILDMCPELSDRAVGACTGLSPKTVASVRSRSTEDSTRLNVRVRSNGKAHPLDRTAERLHAAQLMIARPDLPLRAVVKETGLSLGTVHDVRQRLLRGDTPVPVSRRRSPRVQSPGTDVPASRRGFPPEGPDPLRRAPETVPGRSRTSLEMLRKLASDPALRHSEAGRHFLRWLHDHFVVDDSWRQWTEAVPPHSAATLADLALHCSRTWKRFAEDLASRRLTGGQLSEELQADSK